MSNAALLKPDRNLYSAGARSVSLWEEGCVANGGWGALGKGSIDCEVDSRSWLGAGSEVEATNIIHSGKHINT